MTHKRVQTSRQPAATTSSCSDVRLIARALSPRWRSDLPLEQLLQRHRPWILRRCMSWVGNQSDAEDVAQEVLLRVCAGLHGLEHRSRFRPWLARIVDNQCKTFLSRRSDWVTVEHMERLLDTLAVSTPSSERQYALREQVHYALRSLPIQTRQVLFLRFFEELSLQQIARCLDISLAAAKMRLYRALDRFEQQVHSLDVQS